MEGVSEHEKAVEAVQEAVQHFSVKKQFFRVYHGSTSSTRPLNTKGAIVDISNMTKIFPIDKKTMTVKAEPNVPMDKLVESCIKDGVIPKVVMEFKGITVGGGFSGMSGESSMYKYGLFQNTISEIEIVLGDGTVRIASRSSGCNEDLLREAGGSLGTFGIVTLLTIELIPAKSHVELSVIPTSNPFTIPTIFEKSITDPNIDYMDGIFLRPDFGFVMLGKLIDFQTDLQHGLEIESAVELKKMDVHWFSDSIKAHIEKHKNKTPLPPVILDLTDYLFRYDHGAFWGAKLAFQHFHIPQNRITKKLADPFLDSRTCYRALHNTGLANEYVVQDFGLPESTVKTFMEFVNKKMPKCQMFLCPLMPASQTGIINRFTSRVHKIQNERIFAVGVYGRGPSKSEAFAELNRDLEQQASELFGTKLLYAKTFYTEHEFWDIYDEEHYNRMRKKYQGEWFPSMYEKLKADMSVKSPNTVVRGLLRTMWHQLRAQNV